MTKLKFTKIFRQMTTANVNVCAVNAALYRSPKAFNAVGARACGGNILFVRVIDRLVIKALGCERLISRMFVSVNEAVRPHRVFDDRQERVTATVVHNFGYDIAATFQHANHNSLVRKRALAGFDPASNHGFINLNLLGKAAKHVIAVNRSHVLADFMAHAPSRFVRHAKLTLNFLCGNAIAGCAEQKHDKEPIAQRGASAVKWGASGRIELMPAILTHIGATGADAVVMRALAAASAIVTVAKAVAHDMFKTAIVGWELRLKLAKGGGFRFHAHYLAQQPKCRKGIIAV